MDESKDIIYMKCGGKKFLIVFSQQKIWRGKSEKTTEKN